MTEVSPAYFVTERLHSLFFGRSGSLSEQELYESGVYAVVGSSSSRTTERLEARGEIDGRLAKQTLARDRFGNFHMSTTFLEYGGKHAQADIRKASLPGTFDVIADSLFMNALLGTLAGRQQQ